MKHLPFLILLLLSFHAIHAQEKKPITHEEMWLMKRVGAPAVSPDGTLAVFSVIEPSYDEKEQVNDIWIVATDGNSPPRKLTAGKAGESGYTWSPDGKYIAFVAKRDGDEESQIYTMNIKEGGEAQRLTSLCTGASSPKWSPDGKMILFSSNVYPLCYSDSSNKKMIEEKKKLKYKARVYTSFPIRDFDHWLDEKQQHAFVQSLEPGSAAKDIFTDAGISKSAGFSFSDAAWGPDSREIIFSVSTNANTAAYQEPSSQLYKVLWSGGDAVKLTTDNYDYGNPQLTKDGKYLLCYSYPANNYKVYNLNRLVRFDWPSMQNKMVISEKLDRPINNYTLSGDQVYMSVEDQGRDIIYSLPLNGGEAKVMSGSTIGCFTNIGAATLNSQSLVANYETASSPPEIAKLNTDGTHSLLTKFNSEKLSKLDLPPVETVWFTSKKGKKIRSLLVRPAGFDPAKKYPLFVVIHGGPAGSWKENWGYRWNYHLLAKPGYVLLLTDYTGSTGYGEKFGQDIQNDPFKGPGEEINEAAADAIKRFSFIDASRQAAGGASYGGHLANWLQATTTHYKCLVSHAGLVNSVSQWGTSDVIYSREVMNGGAPWTDSKIWKEQNPYKYAANFKTPMLITVGELDYRVPMNNSIENWHILQRQKIPSKLIVFPEENHWILKAEDSRFFYQELQAWLAEYLK
ncbi:MAG TPA: S9 family peptidase [Chitinophagales bacterium]|nr:S9 family peptidase [Chitinophagales bacterium]